MSEEEKKKAEEAVKQAALAKQEEERRKMEEQLKKVAPNIDPAQYDINQLMEVVGQYSKAAALYYDKTKGMSDEDKKVYEQLLLKTSPNVDIEERFKLADQLLESDKAKREPKPEDKKEDKKEDVKAEADKKDDTKEPEKKSPQPLVDKDSKASLSKSSNNLIADVNEAPLGTNEEVFKWREDRYKAHKTYIRGNPTK